MFHDDEGVSGIGNADAQKAELERNEREALTKCHASLSQLQHQAPDWFAHYEDAQPDSADRETLVELLRTAPDDFSRGLLYGNFLMRMAIASITNREFK